MKSPTFAQALAAAGLIAGAAYSVGRVHADLDTHEAAEGHPALVHRVTQTEKTMAEVAAVLRLLEQRK